MPFEQRTVTYFVCKVCKHEYPIPQYPEYTKVYECSEDGCTNREPFLALVDSPKVSVSTEEGRSFWGKMWHCTMVQGILAGLIVFIILAAATYFITHGLLDNFKTELLNDVRTELGLPQGEK